MRWWKKFLLVVFILVVCLAVLFVALIGPWPTYAGGEFREASYYRTAAAALKEHAVNTGGGDAGAFRAGWAVRPITPPIGTPLSGFGGRRGRPSTGVRDEVNVKAVAVSDGADWAVVVGADMLIVPENLADAVREAVAAKSGLRGWQILFNATHTHSGPGGWAPGLAAKGFSGDYDPAVLELLTQAFTEAILESYGATEPASVAHGSVDASEYIRNRARAAEVDGGLDYMVIEQQDGDRCYVARFSAHPTLLGDDNFEFSGDFPGFLQRFLEAETGGFAMYLGGALGSMSASPPEAADDYARAEKMGEALGRLILEDAPRATRMAAADVASAGSSIPVPPLQLRLSPSWRLSPFAFRLLGIDDDAWVGGVRIGEVLLVGMPCDFSGELSRELRLWGKEQGYSLWMLSFNGDYVGYVSPDKYYGEYDPEEGFGYEMGLMSWCGPNGGGYFSDLAKRVVENLAPARGSAPVQEAANT